MYKGIWGIANGVCVGWVRGMFHGGLGQDSRIINVRISVGFREINRHSKLRMNSISHEEPDPLGQN